MESFKVIDCHDSTKVESRNDEVVKFSIGKVMDLQVWASVAKATDPNLHKSLRIVRFGVALQ